MLNSTIKSTLKPTKKIYELCYNSDKKGINIMLPSEILRIEIAQKYNIDLEQYAWSEEFKQQVFSTELDKDLEPSADTLKEIYLHGFNIGHCGLTSRYIARKFTDADLYYGKAKLLVGTKGAPNGEHAWACINDFLIDTTLMICVPVCKAQELGYVPEKKLAQDSARMLSEYDVFDLEFNKISKKKETLKK